MGKSVRIIGRFNQSLKGQTRDQGELITQVTPKDFLLAYELVSVRTTLELLEA